jgi:ubiquinone/menaquinone biosynthesis C-methylase UbiE
MEAFAKFEDEGWQRVAGKYDSVRASSTRQFIPALLDAAEVTGSMFVLDIGCGPGYVATGAAERGATSRGLDFPKNGCNRTKKASAYSGRRCAKSAFHRCYLRSRSSQLRSSPLTCPRTACAEAFRVLKAGGKFGSKSPFVAMPKGDSFSIPKGAYVIAVSKK